MSASTLQLSLDPIDNATLVTVCGAMDTNVRRLEQEFAVKIRRRASKFTIEGETSLAATAAKKAIERFRYVATTSKRDLSDDEIELTISELKATVASKKAKSTPAVEEKKIAKVAAQETESNDDFSEFAALEAAAGAMPLKVKRADLAARTPTQLEYLKN
ncbi:MAG: hypothetical protein ACRDAM_07405, partial [Casimicrobium sp.]